MEKKQTVIRRLKNDYEYRTVVSAIFSFAATAAFAAYNLFLWFAYGAEWNIGIFVYYALLVCIRAYAGVCEIKYRKAGLDDKQKEEKRKTVFLAQSIMLVIIDIALIAPISFMVLQKKFVNYSAIPAIAMAAYTVYKVVCASVSFAKTRKSPVLTVKMLKNVAFVDAMVSILSLQYTLIMTFGDGVEGKMLTVSSVSSFFIWIFIIIISIISLCQAIKLKKADKA